MFEIKKKEMAWAGKTLTIETGRMARQADGAALVSYGDTVVLATAVYSKKESPNLGFFPLTVQYQEKFYAAGKIPGGYLKREAKPSDGESLISRLIDRPLRPLFNKNFHQETQIICTVLSLEKEVQSDVVAMIAASAAAKLAGLPLAETMAGARVGHIDGNFALNPSPEAMSQSAIDIVVAGTKDGILMVESEINELPQAKILEAISFAHENFKPVIDLIDDLVKDVTPVEVAKDCELSVAAKQLIEKKCLSNIKSAYDIVNKKERSAALSDVRNEICKSLITDESLLAQCADDQESDVSAKLKEIINGQIHKVEHDVVRQGMLESKKRIDGRSFDEIRNIDCQTGVLPRTHGSALFTRGETQALVTVTLGTSSDEKMEDDLLSLPGLPWKHKFMLHYNFPPFSVGEVRRMGPTGRRELGHGKLAWRAINPVLNINEDFQYTLRVVSEVLESNGSSSMATVCGTSMALMDAGIKTKAVAGIAMGLIKEKDQCVILSDIMGDEDHLGDMDFKVAGTNKGITSLQMDLKITSISMETMAEALDQAVNGIDHILDKMNQEIPTHKIAVSDYAPRIEVIKIKADKVRELIGPGGSVIKQISRDSGASIDITEQDSKYSLVTIAATSGEHMKKAQEMVNGIVLDPEIGKDYIGEVVSIKEFGAFIKITPGKDGLLHISEIAKERVTDVNDYLKIGQKVVVNIADFDKAGRIKLKYKDVDQSLLDK